MAPGGKLDKNRGAVAAGAVIVCEESGGGVDSLKSEPWRLELGPHHTNRQINCFNSPLIVLH